MAVINAQMEGLIFNVLCTNMEMWKVSSARSSPLKDESSGKPTPLNESLFLKTAHTLSQRKILAFRYISHCSQQLCFCVQHILSDQDLHFF